MHILILGATGSIGTAVAAQLYAHDHQITALARSNHSRDAVRKLGYTPLIGDISDPYLWIDIIQNVDAVIHLAATFDDTMEQIDTNLMRAICEQAAQRTSPLRMIYTGGCWLYGATGDAIATEDSPFAPIDAFAWSLPVAQTALDAAALNTAVIHPAMVYHETGGVFATFIEHAATNRPLEIWGAATTRWPLIHRDDLAHAYRLLVENRTLTGHFNATAQIGVPVGDITATLAKHFANTQPTILRTTQSVIAQHGTWAKGPTLDQQMSGSKLNAALNWQPAVTDYTTCTWKHR